jgi:hypothetical protein
MIIQNFVALDFLFNFFMFFFKIQRWFGMFRIKWKRNRDLKAYRLFQEWYRKRGSLIEWIIEKIIIDNRGISLIQYDWRPVHYLYGPPVRRNVWLKRWIYRCNYQILCMHSHDGFTFECECHHPNHTNLHHCGDEFWMLSGCKDFEPFFFDFDWSRFRRECQDYYNENEQTINNILL